MSNFCHLNLSMTTTIIDFFLQALLRVHIEHVNHSLLLRKASDPMSHRSSIFHHLFFFTGRPAKSSMAISQKFSLSGLSVKISFTRKKKNVRMANRQRQIMTNDPFMV